MARLGQVAHFSAKGDRNAHVTMDDALENKGYALWLSCQGKIRTTKAPKALGPADRGVGDVSGYEVEVNLKRKCFDLWPGLNQMDRASQDAFISEIYSYLRQSGNAICIRRPGLGEHGIPLWWLREHWNDVKAVNIFRQTELTRAEKRLTAAEAGEDREPSPVAVRRREAEAAAREAAAESPAQTAAKAQTRAEQIIAVIKDSPQPLYQREIADALDLPSLTIGRILRDLEGEGKVYRRLEGKGERPDDASGRYRFLYWHAKRIPLRKTPLDIGNQTMDRVWAMKPGEELRTSWMSPGNQKQVRELVEQGLLEYLGEGTPDERVRLAPTTSSLEQETEETAPEPREEAPETVQEPTPAPTPEVTPPAAPPAQPAVDLSDIAGAIERLVEQRVQARLNETGGHLDAARQETVLAEQRARRAEGLLITARSELSEAVRERDEARELLNGIRKQLGFSG